MEIERIEIICSNTTSKCKKCKNKSNYHILDWKHSEDNYNISQFFNNNIYYDLCNICIKKLQNQFIEI